VLELAQIVLSVLGQQSKLLKSLVDLLVFLRHAVHHPAHWRARLSITKCDLENHGTDYCLATVTVLSVSGLFMMVVMGNGWPELLGISVGDGACI